MGFKTGIIGLPNVGKSTLFNALTKSKSAQAANFPFCTIDPNIGEVMVPDERLQELSKISLSNETIAVVFFRDKGLKKSQQMFSDLNRHAIRPATSIARLYDHRDPIAEVIRRVVYETEVFKGVVEMERSTIAERSSKLFPFSFSKSL